VIARIWHGRVPAEKADAYYHYLERTGLADYAVTPGNRSVSVLRRTENGVTHFLILTVWDSLDSIKAFAGPEYEVARYYLQDDAFLLEREPNVTHYEVL
jgi:heme-degrading monooxygenase HmoA